MQPQQQFSPQGQYFIPGNPSGFAKLGSEGGVIIKARYNIVASCCGHCRYPNLYLGAHIYPLRQDGLKKRASKFLKAVSPMNKWECCPSSGGCCAP